MLCNEYYFIGFCCCDGLDYFFFIDYIIVFFSLDLFIYVFFDINFLLLKNCVQCKFNDN